VQTSDSLNSAGNHIKLLGTHRFPALGSSFCIHLEYASLASATHGWWPSWHK